MELNQYKSSFSLDDNSNKNGLNLKNSTIDFCLKFFIQA